MSLDNIVTVTISTNAARVTRAGFGRILVLTRHNNFTPLTKLYSTKTLASDMVTDGFTANDPGYRSALAAASANTQVPDILIGRLLDDFDQTFELTISGTVVPGDEYSFDVKGPGGVVTSVTYTALVADTTTDVAAALATAATAIADLTVTNTLGVIEFAADNSNEMFVLRNISTPSKMTFEDTTVDSSLATEYGNIVAYNPDFYGVVLADCRSNARVAALGAVVQTQRRLHFAASHDDGNHDSGSTTDTAYVASNASLTRTVIIHSGDQNSDAGAAWAGECFPFDPGSQTWRYKKLAGVAADSLNPSQTAALDGKNANYLIPTAGSNRTHTGVTAGGEWIDTVRGQDWFVARLQERVVSIFNGSRKVPFTNAGIRMLQAAGEAQCEEGIGTGYFSEDSLDGEGGPPYIVTVPDVSQISAADKAARILNGITIQVKEAGAIHAVTYAVTIEV